MGHAPRNPYTLEPVPSHRLHGRQGLREGLQAQQMLELIHQYDLQLMWCDIGGDNDSLHVLAE